MINKLFTKIGSIPKDKILHFVIPYIAFDISLSICSLFDINIILNILISIVVASALILGKELLDKIRYNGWDNKDILAGYIGVILKLIILLLYIL